MESVLSVRTFSCTLGFSLLLLLLLKFVKYFIEPDYSLKLSDICIEKSTDDEVTRQVLRLTSESLTPPVDMNVDVIYRNNKVAFYSRTLRESERLSAPRNWCSQNNATGEFRSLQIVRQIRQCFKAIPVSASDQETISITLRLIRDAFRNKSCPLVMTYGSLLGSLRYHTRMPFDCDYDMAVPSSKWAHVEQIFLELASQPANQMRMINFRPVTGCMQIGLACQQNDSWRYPESWALFNGAITFRNGVPIGHSWQPYKAMMGECAAYLDIYQKDDKDLHLLAFNDGTVPYRPIEGTLFRTLITPVEFLEETYDSRLNVCVPKHSYLHRGSFYYLPKYCTRMSIPCTWLDTIYPRVYAFRTPDNRFIYEVGLESHPNASCWIRSIYYYRT